MSGALGNYVDAFVDGVDGELAGLSGKEHRHECLVEAGDLVSAILASDGRLTSSELEGVARRHRAAPLPTGGHHAAAAP